MLKSILIAKIEKKRRFVDVQNPRLKIQQKKK